MKVTKEEVAEKVKSIIKRQIGRQSVIVKNDSTAHWLGIDSLDIIEIIMEIEDSYSILLEDEKYYEDFDLKKDTVGELTDLTWDCISNSPYWVPTKEDKQCQV